MSQHHRKRVYPEAQSQHYAVGSPTANTTGMPLIDTMSTSRLFTPVQTQLQQQNHMPPQDIAAMHLHNVPLMEPSYTKTHAQGLEQQGTRADPYRSMNQLYPVDLLTELPPPIDDLQLPPPPLMIPPERMLVPSDSANASPDYIRCTMNAIPQTTTLLKRSKLPLALVIRPYLHLNDEKNQPPLNEDYTIIRCRRCRAYLNSFSVFIEQGRRWRCNFCRLANDLPTQFDMTNPTAGIRNRFDRNEVQHAVMEYIAPQEYSVRKPPPSTYCFVLDVSRNAIKSGLLTIITRALIENLDAIPNHDGQTRISIICVDTKLHYLQIPSDDDKKGHISILDIGDLDEPLIPCPHSMVVSLAQCRNNIQGALKKVTELFQNNIMAGFALGPALRGAYMLLSNIGGKIIIASATLPTIGIGALKTRSGKGVYDTRKESHQLFSCQDPFYKTFAVECSKVQITVDSFLASSEYIDVATLSNLSRYTAGQTHYYPDFSAAELESVKKLSTEFVNHISMDLSIETVMRGRGSIGLKMDKFFGHFFNRSSDLCAFSTMPRDQSYVFEVKMDENIVADVCYFQIAILFSLNNSQRRIRVITLAIPTTTSLGEVYASADQLALTAYYTQLAVTKGLNSSFEEARELLSKTVYDLLLTYRKEITAPDTAGSVPLRASTNLRMLPLLLHSLCKSMAFRAGPIPSDHRAAVLNLIETLPVKYLVQYIYPTVYSLHDMDDLCGIMNESGEISLPKPINATSSIFERYGLYLISNGMEMFLWIGGDAVPELVMDLFGMTNIFEIPMGKHELPIIPDSPLNQKTRNIIDFIRTSDDTIIYQSLYIVRGPSLNEPVNQRGSDSIGALRMWVSTTLVEDKIMKSESYREFLQKLKSQINK